MFRREFDLEGETAAALAKGAVRKQGISIGREL